MRHALFGLAVLASAIAAPEVVAASPHAAAATGAVTHRTLVWHGVQAHVVRVPKGAQVRPVARRPGKTVPAFAAEQQAVAAINGGYFNHSDGYPVSHVVVDGRPVNDPRQNKALVDNPVLKPILPKIFDERVEWRAMTGPGGTWWRFEAHSAPSPFGVSRTHALQAGPRLLPQRDLEREGFVVRDRQGTVVRDGIGSTSPAARSALGLTASGDLLLVAVAGSSKAVRGISIAQLADLLTHVGATEAIALDGGSSTSLTWKENGRYRTFVGSGQGPALVHSALLVF